MGLQDMVAALRWVRDNIGQFGGDPGNVTLVGQSAGAHAIMCLLTMWDTHGLFHRAILQSPPANLAPQDRAGGRAQAEKLCRQLGVAADALMHMPVADLLAAQTHLARAGARPGTVAPPFLPVLDHLSDAQDFIDAAATEAAARGIDLIIGTTREEMHGFLAADPAMDPPAADLVAARFAALSGAADAIALYRRRRPGGSPMDLLGDLLTDHNFLFPSLALADAVARAGGTVWAYQFDWAPPGSRFRACHCIELPFLFGNFADWPDAGMLEGGDRAEMAGLSAVLRAAWAEFADNGDPHVPGLLWPPYTPELRQTMVFGNVVGPVGDPAGAVWRGGVVG